MPRLGRTALLKRDGRWSGTAKPDRRNETPREAEARRLEAARQAARGSV